MKAAKIRNNKREEIKKAEENYSIRKMIMIVIIVSLTFFIFYFITTLVVNPVEEANENNVAEIDSSKITLNNLLDRKEEKYYVLATKKIESPSGYSQVDYNDIYNGYIDNYNSVLGILKFYRVDLDDALNKSYYSEELNITDNLEELKINDDILFKINNGKIEEYFVGSSKIVEALSKLKEF